MHLSPHSNVPAGIAGGLLIGASSSALLLLTGRLSGQSGILAGALTKGEPWRYAYVCGLLVAGASMARASPSSFGAPPTLTPAATALAGVAVGLGARLGGGCTSGHGVCGLPRLSPRSLAAVATFMASGALTAWAVRGSALLFSAPLSLPAPLAGSASLLATALPAAASALLAAAACRGCFGSLAAGGPAPAPASAAPPPALSPPAAAAHAAAAFACALLFGTGLVVSGMADPGKVSAFLDFSGPNGWDPTLAGVMGGAVALNLVTFSLLRRYVATPLLDASVTLRACAPLGRGTGVSIHASGVDARLLAGAALFGVGWGLAGVCPGPALVSLGAGRALAAGVFVPAMLAGVTAHELLLRGA